MQSLKSNALEPTRRELAGLSPFSRFVRLLPVFGLPILTLLLIALFSLILPDTFPTLLNVRSIVGDKSIIAILALAAMIPMATGRIDLTVGYGIVLWHILAISLQTSYGIDWRVAVVIVLALGALLGLLNGVLVEVAQIDSFIATLGTGTVLYAIAMWHTGGRQVIGTLPDAFTSIFTTSFFGLPIAATYVIVIAVVLWLASDYLPIGRYLYAIGANPRAAALNGIPARRYVILAFVSSGVLTAFAGIVLAAKLRIGQASVGLDFLLPALVGAFLGSTTIKPGRVNVWGTVFGVSILAVGIAGIQQLGGDFYVEPLFNGATLLVAIGIAGYTQRRHVVHTAVGYRTHRVNQTYITDRRHHEAPPDHHPLCRAGCSVRTERTRRRHLSCRREGIHGAGHEVRPMVGWTDHRPHRATRQDNRVRIGGSTRQRAARRG
jgi:ribose transport system permease protein